MAVCLALHGGRQLLRIGNGDLVNLLGSARSLSTPSTSAIRPSMFKSAETLYELASKLLVCGNGGNHLGCPVSFCMSGRYRFGVSFFLGCPVSFCSGFNISLLIEQPSLLLYNNGNFDPGSYVAHIDVFQEACEGSIGRMQRKMVQGLAGCKVSVLQRLENSHEENSKERIRSHL